MDLAEIFQKIQEYLEYYPIIAPFLYILIHILLAVFIIPCSPMTVIAGILWGKWLGLIISLFSAYLSTNITFWLSRRFFRKKIYIMLRRRYPKTKWFLEKTREHGWKFVAGIQLNPAAPASTLGYLFGLTKISYRAYAALTLIFMIPLQITLVWVGDSVPSLANSGRYEVFLGSLLLFAIACAITKMISKFWSASVK